MATDMDVLVLEKFVLLKEEQPGAGSIARRITSPNSNSTRNVKRVRMYPAYAHAVGVFDPNALSLMIPPRRP